MAPLQFLLLAPLALAATLERRTDNGAAVNQAITNISKAVVKMTAAINAYDGGILQTQPTFDAALVVHYVNRMGYAEAIASSEYTEAESEAIVQNVNNSVGVTIPEAVTAIEAKKPLFDAANVTSLVEATILLLKYDHESFSAAVGANLTPDQVAPGAVGAGKIDAVLEGAALYYAT